MNLKSVATLLVDSDRFTRGLVVQMLRGFRMDSPVVCDSGAAAKEYLQQAPVDLCIVEAVLPDMASPELIRWIRRPEMGAVRFIPVIVLSGYTQQRMVATARDAGANTVLKKPASPQALFDRIMWVARVPRPFIDAGSYVGPDRRFKAEDPPDKTYKRADDPATPVSDSQTPNNITAVAMKGAQ
jgi:DNA-binding response OmpR family regulator